jgi:HEAT repeat protein
VPYRTYEEIAKLNADAQCHLLQHGDAVERVWAAWARGLSLGRTITPELLGSLRDSPAAGTRRHLLVVLAGLGEHEVLRVFAQDDPDDLVRATACRYLIRISDSSDNSVDQFLQERLLDDESPIVREAILTEAPMGRPSVRFEDLAMLARDSNFDVRQAAIERLLQAKPFDQLFPGILAERITHEDNDVLRERLLSLCSRADGGALLDLCPSLAPARRDEILRLLINAKEHFKWEQLAPLTRAADPRLDQLLIHLLDPNGATSAAVWLLRGIARAATWPGHKNREEAAVALAVNSFAWHATQRLFVIQSDLMRVDRTSLDRLSIEAVVTLLREQIREIEQESEDDEWDDEESRQQAIQERMALVDVLTRMIQETW